MPIYEILCQDCGKTNEALIFSNEKIPDCPACGSINTSKLMSATSSLTGQPNIGLPGAGDTSCCGSQPGTGSCSGPGSCCGKG